MITAMMTQNVSRSTKQEVLQQNAKFFFLFLKKERFGKGFQNFHVPPKGCKGQELFAPDLFCQKSALLVLSWVEFTNKVISEVLAQIFESGSAHPDLLWYEAMSSPTATSSKEASDPVCRKHAPLNCTGAAASRSWDCIRWSI